MNRRLLFRALLAGLASTVLPLGVHAAHPNFEEPEVDVLYSLFGEQPGDSFGWVADPLGDISGDGVSDLITSAPFRVDGGGNLIGKVYVYSGADGALLFEEEGPFAGERAGYSATSAGDVNNDGIPDYVYGSRTRVRVRSGADHALLHEWVMPGEGFGFDTASAGDLDGDGHDDVIVGAPFAGYGGPSAGRLYAFSGADGSVLWTFDGQAGWLNGLGVGKVGDVNGDGVPDVVTAAHGALPNFKGAAFVLSGADGSVLLDLVPQTPSPSANGQSTFGRFHCHGAGDVDLDGIPDVYVGDFNAKGGNQNPNSPNSTGGFGKGRAFVYSGADGSIIHNIRAENFGDGMGPGRGVPDVDGDGHADLFVAAYAFGEGDNQDVGKGYLFSGVDGAVLRTMTGRTPGEFVGVDALSVHDVNGDGLTDYALTGFGSLYVVLGR